MANICFPFLGNPLFYYLYKSVPFTKNDREGLKLVSKINGNFSIKFGKTGLPVQTLPCSWKFSAERHNTKSRDPFTFQMDFPEAFYKW